MQPNHTPLPLTEIWQKHFRQKKYLADIMFFALGVFTAIIFLTLFYALQHQRAISLL